MIPISLTQCLVTGVRHTFWLRASLAITVASFAACTTPPAQDSKAQDSMALDSKALESEAPAADCCAYVETFLTASIRDCESDRCEVRWCAGAKTVKFSCAGSPGRALGVLASDSPTDWPVARVSWGELDAREVRIEFKYWQHQGEAKDPNLASSRLEIQWFQSSAFDPNRCPTIGFTPILCLPRTETTDFTCFPASIVIPVPEGERALYIRFAKSKSMPRTPLLYIDDLRITVVEDT
jgi:hypothetical protein